MIGKEKEYNINKNKRGGMVGNGCSGKRNKMNTIGGHRFASASSTEDNETAIMNIFATISDDDDPNVASMEGICKLCEELQLDPIEDIRILVLMWKMGANGKPGQITKTEWTDGCTKLHIESMEKLKTVLPGLETGFLDNSEFRFFFKFCFKFNLQGSYKTLDKDLALDLIQLALKDRVAVERLKTFSDFLKSSKDATYERITLDQWTSFWDFCVEVPDIKNYDEENSAWPTLIDDYIVYMDKIKLE